MACEPQLFDVTAAQFDAGAKQLGLTKDVGDFAQSGVKAAYIFDRKNSKLTVNVTSKPFIVPCSTIFSKIQDALK